MFAAIIGSCMGSFMMCVTNPSGQLFRRSNCSDCGHKLACQDLIPIVSFVLRRGKCGYCHAAIPISLLMAELLFAFFFLYFSNFNSAVPLIMITFLIPLSIYDIYYFKVPDHMLLMFLILLGGVNYMIFMDSAHLITVLMISIFLHLFYFLTRSIGYGDIKLLLILALCLPWQYFFLIFLFTYISGGIAAMIFLFYKYSVSRLPLVPFITFSTLFVVTYFKELHLIYFGGFV